jgi:hypothetical protein
MNERKRARLEAAGWTIGDAGDFLGLSEVERREIDLRIELAQAIRRRRQRSGKGQAHLGKAIGSTQPRIARMEAAAKGVSLDQMFRAFFATGGELPELIPSVAGAKRGATAAKAALTKKRKAAGVKAAQTRKRRGAAQKATATRKKAAAAR